jgi:transcriptional regulator GlxA family with amidase domain
MYDVTVVFLEGGLSSTAVIPVEIFHSAGALWHELQGRPPQPLFRVRTVTIDGGPVRCSGGFSLSPEASLTEVDRTDIVIIPTTGMDLEARLAEAGETLLPWLRRQHGQGAVITGVCMGSALIAESGLLDGRTATAHWALGEQMAARWPQVHWKPELFVTEDTRVICSGGLYGSIDVSLYLVERLCGREIAVQCAKALLLPMPRQSQSGYAMTPVARQHDNERIRLAESFLQANLERETPVRDLARMAGLSERTFARHFKACTGRNPSDYVQALRVEAAKAHLENGLKAVQTVSSEVGYDDVAFFRALFKRATGMTPAEYRAQFGPRDARTPIGAYPGSSELGL